MKLFLVITFFSLFVYASVVDDAVLYEKGVKYRTQKEYKKAFDIFTQLAKKEYDKVQYDLALMYEQGLGIDKDANKSLYWLEKSAEHGNRDALNFLAQKYYNGWDVDVNKTKAKQFLIKSKDLNSSTAKILLDRYKLND